MFAPEDIAANGPQLAAFDYGHCFHRWVERHGTTEADGSTIWQCRQCRTCFRPYWSATRDRAGELELSLRKLVRCYLDGYSAEVVYKKVNCTRSFAYNWYRKFRKFGKVPLRNMGGKPGNRRIDFPREQVA